MGEFDAQARVAGEENGGPSHVRSAFRNAQSQAARTEQQNTPVSRLHVLSDLWFQNGFGVGGI
jgi:hypothetical protein